jgi:hypothetical protein
MFPRTSEASSGSGFDVDGVAGENVDNLLGATLAATDFSDEREEKSRTVSVGGRSLLHDDGGRKLLDHPARSGSMVCVVAFTNVCEG